MQKKRNRSNKKKMYLQLLGMIAVCITAIGVLGVRIYPMLQPQRTADVVFKEYLTHLERAEYAKMYELLDKDSKAYISKKEFVQKNRNIYEGMEAEQFQFSIELPEKRNAAMLSYSMEFLTIAGPISFQQNAEFTRSSDGFLLHWNPSCIVPQLEEGDRIKVIRKEAIRGQIYDRSGIMLAGQGAAYQVGLVPGRMKHPAKKDIKKLAELLETTEEAIQKKLSASWVKEDSFVPIKIISKPDPLAEIAAVPDEEEKKKGKMVEALLNIQGVMLNDAVVRSYPYKEQTGHLLGYVQVITAEEQKELRSKGYTQTQMLGKSGLEKLYEKRLKGQDGIEIAVIKEDGQMKASLASTPKKNGKDITLSIDIRMQSVLHERFKEEKSCSVAMNPLTGEVLALVSTPSYDSNDFVNGLSQSKWNDLNENKAKPLWNRFRSVFSPGSAMKPIVAAMGITNQTLNPDKDYGKPVYSWQKDKSWGNYRVTTLHTYQTGNLLGALVHSDNIYFAKAALRMGAKSFTAELDRLGFGETLPFELGMTESSYSNEDSMASEIQLADSGYGQGQMLINPLHMASVYSALANDGNMITPTLLLKDSSRAKWWKESVFTKEAVDIVKTDMVQVIEDPNGTGRGARLPGITLAGKTGTAEIKVSQSDTSGTELGWFVVYPSNIREEEPVMLISMVEDVKGRGGSGLVIERIKPALQMIYGDRKDWL